MALFCEGIERVIELKKDTLVTFVKTAVKRLTIDHEVLCIKALDSGSREPGSLGNEHSRAMNTSAHVAARTPGKRPHPSG